MSVWDWIALGLVALLFCSSVRAANADRTSSQSVKVAVSFIMALILAFIAWRVIE